MDRKDWELQELQLERQRYLLIANDRRLEALDYQIVLETARCNILLKNSEDLTKFEQRLLTDIDVVLKRHKRL